MENNSYIIVATKYQADWLAKYAAKIGYPQMLYPVTVNEYLYGDKMRGSYVKNVLIDDADHVLQTIFDTVRIDAITLSEQD